MLKLIISICYCSQRYATPSRATSTQPTRRANNQTHSVSMANSASRAIGITSSYDLLSATGRSSNSKASHTNSSAPRPASMIASHGFTSWSAVFRSHDDRGEGDAIKLQEVPCSVDEANAGSRPELHARRERRQHRRPTMVREDERRLMWPMSRVDCMGRLAGLYLVDMYCRIDDPNLEWARSCVNLSAKQSGPTLPRTRRGGGCGLGLSAEATKCRVKQTTWSSGKGKMALPSSYVGSL